MAESPGFVGVLQVISTGYKSLAGGEDLNDDGEKIRHTAEWAVALLRGPVSGRRWHYFMTPNWHHSPTGDLNAISDGGLRDHED
jgi:hypothetical protein